MTSASFTLGFVWCLLQPVKNSNLFNQWAAKKRYAIANAKQACARASKWNRENKLRRNARLKIWNREQQENNLQRTLSKNLRTRMWFALSAQHCKSKNVMRNLGCTVEEFKRHIEKQFQPGWTWENWGTAWEIDHIKACVKFDLSDPAQVEKCFHFSNQRPLGIFENRSKGAK